MTIKYSRESKNPSKAAAVQQSCPGAPSLWKSFAAMPLPLLHSPGLQSAGCRPPGDTRLQPLIVPCP